jgi:N-carbamoylputrescine amidase
LGPVQHQAWELIQRSHALANGVYVAAVNRVGHEGADDAGLEFWGSSFVSDPFGSLMQRAGAEAEENLLVSCDLRRLEEIRRHWPFLRDRRIDAYGDITRRIID